jgi:putative acetyltransferase
MKDVVIKPYHEELREDVIALWEKSVRATHDFLIPEDIDYFKQIVKGIDFKAFEVFCSFSGKQLTGFAGLSGNKIEMLFIDPAYIGKGYGKALLQFAMDEFNATEVDVNEGNKKAVDFYTKFGFIAYERMPKDSEGKDYPILKMKLKSELP